MTVTGFFKKLFGRHVSDQSARSTRSAPKHARRPQLMTNVTFVESIGE